MQSISLITLGVDDLARSRRFYADGFGWTPGFENDQIAFYQMNGFVFATWLRPAMQDDTGLAPLPCPGAVTVAHNLADPAAVQPLLDRLAAHGGRVLRPAETVPWGGVRGYVADPDGHVWEVAHNPAWPISPDGHVTLA